MMNRFQTLLSISTCAATSWLTTVEETIPDTGVANVHVWGRANFTFPCPAGDRQKFDAHV